jgi:hypothetical protein
MDSREWQGRKSTNLKSDHTQLLLLSVLSYIATAFGVSVLGFGQGRRRRRYGMGVLEYVTIRAIEKMKCELYSNLSVA